MRRRLPPLNALRAFEAVGRNLSFKGAAEELFVTPGAVSRQIRVLEEHLGIALFDRNHRDVRLTEASRVFVRAISDVFDQVERTSRRVVDASQGRPIHIYCSMTFALRWLVPRLTAFHEKYGQQDIQLTATRPRAIDLAIADGDVDVAIQSEVSSPEMISHRLIDIAWLPVCSPKFLATHGPIVDVADLMRHTLLHSSARPQAWENWLGASGAAEAKPRSTIVFESSSLAYTAAIQGAGIAMGIKCLIEDDLAARRLVPLLSPVSFKDDAFSIVYSAKTAPSPQLVKFRDWLLSEAKADLAVRPRAKVRAAL